MKRNRFRIIGVILLLIITRFSSFGQTQINYDQVVHVIPPLPEASSLGKYGETPVNLYTGQANINIPLYTISVGDINLPISLSYATGGIKVSDIASQVGLGFSLNAGGVITRSVVGRPDDILRGYLDKSYQVPSGALTLEPYKANEIATGLTDSESDIYFFNFNGNTGSFFFDRNGNIHHTYLNKIKFEVTRDTYEITSFKATTGDGFVYIFDVRERQTHCTAYSFSDKIDIPEAYGAYGCNGPEYTGSWYLSKIISPTGKELKFEYESYVQAHYEILGQHMRYVLDKSQTYTLGVETKKSFKSKTTINSLYAKRINKITGNGVVVNFIKGEERLDLPSSYCLKGIEVNNNSSLIKKIEFQYYYPNGDKRLMLQKVIDKGTSSTKADTYEFVYNDGLPSRLSYAQDHWGYYNAKVNNILVPDMIVNNGKITGGNRDVNSLYSKAGALIKIIYPTGGRTEYEYESNDANTYFPYERSEQQGSELRIDAYNGFSGINWSSCNAVIERYKDFTLTNSEIVSISMSSPDDYETIGYYNTGVEWELLDLQENVVVATNQSFKKLYGTGSTYYYSLFEAKGLYLPGNRTYRIIHKMKPCFYNKNATYYSFNVTWTHILTGVEIAVKEVGGLRLKSVKDIDNVNNVTSQKEYFYRANNVSTGVIPFYPFYNSKYTENVVIKQYLTNIELFGTYLIGKSSPFYLGLTQGASVGYSSVEEITNGKYKNVYEFSTSRDYPDEYDFGNGTFFNITESDWRNTLLDKPYLEVSSNDNYRGKLLKKTTFLNNNGTYVPIRIEKNTYSKTFGDSNPDNFSELFLKVAVTKNDRIQFEMIKSPSTFMPAGFYPSYILYWYKKKNGYLTLDKTVVEERDGLSDKWMITEQNFEYNIKNLQPQKITIQSSNGEVITKCFKYPSDIYYNGVTATSPSSLALKNLVDRNIIIPVIEQFSQLSKDGVNKLKDATLLEYDQSLPVIKTVYKAELINPNTSFDPANIVNGNVVKSSLYKPNISVSYNPNCNPLEKSINELSKAAFLWDYNNIYPIAEVKNATQTDIAYCSFEADGKGNWSFTGTPTDDLKAPTGTKVYNIANGAISKSGLTATTEYVVSYWTKNTSAFTITGTQGAAVKVKSFNGWNLFEHKVKGVASVSISGTGLIDELRLYPSDAQMTTYTYTPLVGITSSTDAKGQTTYYEYDDFQRLKWIKDQEGNILKATDYHYQNQ